MTETMAEESPSVIVRLDDHGAVLAVEIPGHDRATELVMTVPSTPVAPFWPDGFPDSMRSWLVNGHR